MEDAPGPAYRVSDANALLLGPRLSAALAHAHLLVFHPRDASARELQALLDAGWSVIRCWEHEDASDAANRVMSALRELS